MTKAELILEVQRLLGPDTPALLAERAVESVLQAVQTGLRRDGTVKLVNFGVFDVATRAAHKGFNPHTKKPIRVKATRTVRFRPGLTLRHLEPE
jgi:DNA-binding protein HU-beta